MNNGVQPIPIEEYTSLRSRQMPLSQIDFKRTPYQFVGRVVSQNLEAALFDIYNLRVQTSNTGRVALNAMLLRDEWNEGIRPFQGYETLDENDLPTIFPDNGTFQLYTPKLDRFELVSGYLITHISKAAAHLYQPNQSTLPTRLDELCTILQERI